MRKFKSLIYVVVFMAFVLSLNMGVPQAARAKTIELTFYTIMPVAGYFGQGFAKFIKMVEENSNSRIKINAHYGAALGFKGHELLPVMKKRMVDIAEIQLFKNDGSDPFLGISTLPGTTKSLGEAHVLDIVARPYIEEVLSRWNAKYLFTCIFMGQQIHSKKPIKSLADIKGVKTRVFDKNSSDTIRALGGAPITIPWADVYTSLQRGVVDAVVTSAMSACDGHFWEVLKCTNLTNIVFPASCVSINKKAWDELPADLKVIVLEAAKEMENWFWFQAYNMQSENIATLKKNGMKIVDLTDEVHAEMGERLKPMWGSWIEKVGPDGKAALEKYSAAVSR
jgi:TRAP-type C4-dicarboxylate transport system substrate-binding protein